MTDANPFSDVSQRPFSATASVQAPKPTNTVGLIGLILSLAGILTCGVLFPFGFLVSLFGLFKAPRGLAVAGTVVGFLGTAAICAAVSFAMLANSRVVVSAQDAREKAHTVAVMQQARNKIELRVAQSNVLPDGIEGNKEIYGLKDAWQKDLRYETDGEGIVIRSAGEDGQFNTDDDLELNSDGEFTGRQFTDDGLFSTLEELKAPRETQLEVLEGMEKELLNDIQTKRKSVAPSIR